jgi:hypothetical protein
MWICVKESVVVLTLNMVALQGEGPVRETIYFSRTIFTRWQVNYFLKSWIGLVSIEISTMLNRFLE